MQAHISKWRFETVFTSGNSISALLCVLLVTFAINTSGLDRDEQDSASIPVRISVAFTFFASNTCGESAIDLRHSLNNDDLCSLASSVESTPTPKGIFCGDVLGMIRFSTKKSTTAMCIGETGAPPACCHRMSRTQLILCIFHPSQRVTARPVAGPSTAVSREFHVWFFCYGGGSGVCMRARSRTHRHAHPPPRCAEHYRIFPPNAN